MRTRLLWGALTVALIGLAACGEREQTANPRRSDTVAWQGAQNPYGAPGWKSGDRASWEAQMRTRAQAQNEYPRVH